MRTLFTWSEFNFDSSLKTKFLSSSSRFNEGLSLIVNVTVVPKLITDSIFILPPNIFTNFWDIVNPRPVPFMLNSSRCLWIIPKTWNNQFLSSSEIPIPVSLTLIFKNLELFSRLVCIRAIAIVIPPRFVNLYEFEIKFIRICRILSASESNIILLSLSSHSTLNQIPFCFHWFSKINSISLMRTPISNGFSLRLNMSASIFAKSSMSSVRLATKELLY